MIPRDFPRFLPCRGLGSAHLQTLMASLVRPQIPYRATRHVVPLEDGDAIVLHDDCPPSWRSGDRVVLLLHGVAGCHASPYLVRTAYKLNQRGWRTFRMDLRGMGAGATLAAHPGHAGRSGDARAAADWIDRRCPGSPIAIVGFSMGGNILLKLLGETPYGLPPGLDRALAVAPPVDLLFCAQNLNRGMARLYSRALTRMLLDRLRQQETRLAALGTRCRPEQEGGVRDREWEERGEKKACRIRQSSEDPVPQCRGCSPLPRRPRRLWDFDDWITAPLSGFDSAETYYAASSSAPLLQHIRLPTLIVSAADDPLIPIEMFHRHSASRTVSLHVTERGGHVGFLGRRGLDPDRWWLDWRIVDWIGARCTTRPVAGGPPAQGDAGQRR